MIKLKKDEKKTRMLMKIIDNRLKRKYDSFYAGLDQSTYLRGYVHLLPEEIKISFCTKFIIVIFSDPKI